MAGAASRPATPLPVIRRGKDGDLPSWLGVRASLLAVTEPRTAACDHAAVGIGRMSRPAMSWTRWGPRRSEPPLERCLPVVDVERCGGQAPPSPRVHVVDRFMHLTVGRKHPDAQHDSRLLPEDAILASDFSSRL